jgi:hypothetical protein
MSIDHHQHGIEVIKEIAQDMQAAVRRYALDGTHVDLSQRSTEESLK